MPTEQGRLANICRKNGVEEEREEGGKGKRREGGKTEEGRGEATPERSDHHSSYFWF